MADTIVIGLGNPLYGDEGIGIFILEKLVELYDCSAIECLDMGTSIFSILHVLENKKKALIVDCAFMGLKPGAIRRFTIDQARSIKEFGHLTLHEGDLFSVLKTLESYGKSKLPEVDIYGIEPAVVEMGAPLSGLLRKNLAGYCDLIAAECMLMAKNG